jgi:hypothetical protein
LNAGTPGLCGRGSWALRNRGRISDELEGEQNAGGQRGMTVGGKQTELAAGMRVAIAVGMCPGLEPCRHNQGANNKGQYPHVSQLLIHRSSS